MTGRVAVPALLAALLAATEGWLRPLLLLAEAAAEGTGLEDGALAALPGTLSFLRHEVLAGLDASERAMAWRLALAGSADPELWRGLLDAEQRSALERLRDAWGLVIEGGEGEPRLPAPLTALLSGSARYEPGAGRLAMTLAAAERRRGRPLEALRLLTAADAAGANPAAELSGLLAGEWPALLAEAPLGALGRVAARLPAPAPPGAELARRLSAGLLAGSPATAEAAVRLARWAEREARDTPAVAAAARLAAALLAPPSGAGSEPAAVPAAGAALPSPLAPLAALVAAFPRAGEAPDGGDEGLEEEGDGERDEGPPALAAAVAAALAALPPPPGPPDLLIAAVSESALDASPAARPSSPDPGASLDPRSPALAVLAGRALDLLLDRRPGLAAALRGRPDLPAGWRDRLEPVVPPPAPADGYRLELLGEGRVQRRERGRERELSWPLKRALKALAFLATSPGRRAGRGELEDALWPGADEDGIRRNFHPTLSHLRRSLEAGLERPWAPPLLLESGVYRLNPALSWRLDTERLERLLAAGEAALEVERVARAAQIWERARDLYRGPFLAGWDEAWIVTRRERYQRLWLELLRGLGEVYIRLGRVGEAIDLLRTVLIHDPLQERVHQALMEAYGRQGRRDLVHRQWERLVEQLSRELGDEEPMEATREAYQRLMA